MITVLIKTQKQGIFVTIGDHDHSLNKEDFDHDRNPIKT